MSLQETNDPQESNDSQERFFGNKPESSQQYDEYSRTLPTAPRQQGFRPFGEKRSDDTPEERKTISRSRQDSNTDSSHQNPDNDQEQKPRPRFERGTWQPRENRSTFLNNRSGRSNTGQGGNYTDRDNNYQNRGGGYNDNRGGGYNDNRGGGYNDNRGGGYNDNRGGGYNDNRGGYNANRGSGYNANRGGGYNDNRGGGYNDNRGGGYNYNRGGGYQNRGSGYNDNRGGGYNDNRGSGYQNRGGGYNDNRGGGYQNRGGGYNDNRGGGYQDRGGYGDSRSGGQRKQFDKRPESLPPGKLRYDPNKRQRLDRNNPDARQALKLERPYKQKEKKLPGTTLVKALVSYQFASRSACLKAINDNRIQINGTEALNQNTYVKMDKDVLQVDGITLVRKNYKPIYLVFNKPRGVIGSKESKKLTTYSYLVNKRGWHIPSGALTKHASGIVLVTNDIRHKNTDATPLLDLTRDIHVKVHRTPKKSELTAVAEHINSALGDENQNVTVTIDTKIKRAAWIKVGMRRGSISLITKALKASGLEVLAIDRRRLGPFHTKDMGPGAWYRLSDEEIAALLQLSKEKPANDSASLQSFWKSISSKFFSSKNEEKE